jgi:mannose-1-phosphate guanylyltransferase/phosphomannomutase
MVGRVMHRLISEPAGAEVDTTDGVKFILNGGWVLVLPDGEQPMLRMVAEGWDARMTHDLMKHHVAKIEWIIDSQ